MPLSKVPSRCWEEVWELLEVPAWSALVPVCPNLGGVSEEVAGDLNPANLGRHLLTCVLSCL